MVESLVKYPNSVTQTTGGSYVTFSNISNICNGSDTSYAYSSTNIKAKNSSPNRPSTVSCSNFGFSLPTGAEIVDVTVYYRHAKIKVGNTVCNIPAPTISLLGVSGFSGKGSAPTTTNTTFTKTFSGSALTRSVVNSSSFGVKINYPANTNSYEGKMDLVYVRLLVHYKVPSYSLSLKKVSGGYNEEKYTLQCSISNLNLTSYSPTLTLSAPTGFSFSSASGSGTYTKVNNRTITWNPKLTSKIGTASLDLEFDVDVTYPVGTDTYTGTFTLVESLYSTTKNFTATITERPPTPSEDVDPDEPIIDGGTASITAETEVNVISGQGFIMEFEDIQLVDDDITLMFNGASSVDYTGSYYDKGYDSSLGGYYYVFKEEDLPISGEWTITAPKKYTVNVNANPQFNFYLNIQPLETDLTVPFFTVLEPSEEELNRLGDGFTYIAQADIKHTTTDTNTRDWYKNNRIGICNTPQTRIADNGTSNNHNDIWATTNATLTRETDYSLLTETSATGYCMLNSDNKISPNQTIEFDICQTDSTTTNAPIYIRNDGGGSSLSTISYSDLGASLEEWVHIKIVFNNTSTITIYADTLAEPITKTLSATSTNYRLMLYCGGTITQLQFKNVKIYDTILSTGQIYDNAVWSKATAGLNEYNNVECEFVYDETYPLYILMTGDYPEAEDYGYDMGTIKYDTPAIIEKQVYNSREPSGNYPLPIEALLTGEDIATLQLAKDQTSQGVVLYDFPVDETVSTNDRLAIRGLQVRANIEATDNLVIQAKLHSPNGEVGNRSILVDSQDEEIVIGGLGDLWGFTTLQMTHLELWQLELSVANILSQSDSSILFNNVEIIFYLETVEKQEITIRVEDEDIAYYGAFIETVKIPEGLNTDTSFLSIDGTDTNDAYRQNIREKTITIEFNLSNCELQTSTDMLRQLTKLFVNEKDQYNRPIPKKIQFSHYPNDYFEYIMEEPFDVDTEITDHTIKAQLTVPSGTSYSLYDTVTNTTGNANGLAAINPIIHIRPSDSNIQIKEGISEQSFQMGYAGDWSDYIVEIDCDDRRAYIIKDEDTKIDISKYVDHNSDWFRLSGEFEFESINCTILTVTFNERW